MDIEFGHVDGILKQLSSDRVNWQLHLPSGVVVQKEYDVLRFVPEPATENSFNTDWKYQALHLYLKPELFWKPKYYM